MRHPLRQLLKLHDWHVRIHCRLLLIPCMLGRSHKYELKMLLQFDNVPFPQRSVLKTHKVLLFGAICPVLSAIFSVIGRMLSNELWKPELFSFPFVAQESTVSPPHGWQHCCRSESSGTTSSLREWLEMWVELKLFPHKSFILGVCHVAHRWLMQVCMCVYKYFTSS